MLKKKNVNVLTGEETWIDLSADEIAEVEQAKAEVTAEAQKLAQIAAKKVALLEKLGITEEEAKLLLS